MAVLAPQDWHPPRDLSMDAPPNAINTSVPRQRSSPANDHSATSTPISQPPYPYPVQQQQAGWSQPHPPQPYYPSYYQNPHQQAYQLHAHPGQGPMHTQTPYYDPTNAHLAQWAYQQMMYNAHQAHQMSHVPSPQPHPGQRSRTGSASTGDYFVPPQMAGYSPFPSGTPPAHPSQLPAAYAAGQTDQSSHTTQYNGYHPYRRPNRQGSQHQEPPQASPPGDRRAGPFQPPYARTDAAGSSTSVNSSHSGSSRHRTNSLQSSTAPSGSGGKSGSTSGSMRGGNAPAPNLAPVAAPTPRPHQRTGSSSSVSSSATSRPSVASTSATSNSSQAASTLRKPSPLSQGNFTAAEKRMSRDDSDLAAMLEPAPGVRSGGLKGRLRRALSLNAGSTLREEDEDEQPPTGSSRRPAAVSSSSSTVLGDDESTATVQKKKSKSLFNSRLNRSTDNISLSSTMSSASMVIRKLGNIGKLTRRNSLAGITSLFKDKKEKDKEGGEEEGKKSKKKKDSKGAALEPSVSHATAELDPAEWSADLTGLSPAARLARQHTLKSNAEAAARAKAEQEAKAANATASQGAGVPGPWEKNTSTRQGDNAPGKGLTRISEDGSRVFVEDDSDSEDGHDGSGMYPQNMEGWDEDDDEWGEAQDEDVTIRQALERTSLDEAEMEPWAINVRRSVERTRKPAKGILKMRSDGSTYDQDMYSGRSNTAFGRNRSNSYDSTPSHGELGPLAHIPSPDPDHIDGLHKHTHPPASASPSPFLPPLSFDSKGLTAEPSKDSDASTIRAPTPEKTFFSHPNSSAPALSTVFSSNPPTLTQRPAATPKRLAFATNLSVYDTFPAAVYDRRSEPATWSRLTPALAQRIKEELNSYKMEEMEVHASSRIHTQFFV
ncbi:hypothetical protein BDW22DRAFT_1483317 [Trametopsis cervina]|nr:hypothetical protein BDW22DRAFT_1483317 [Trametopsis cervina]